MSKQSKALWGTFLHALAVALGIVVLGLLIGLGLEYLDPLDTQERVITQQAPAESVPSELQRYALEQAWAQFPPEDHAAICSLDLEWATDQIVAGVTEADLDPYMVRDFLIEKCEEF